MFAIVDATYSSLPAAIDRSYFILTQITTTRFIEEDRNVLELDMSFNVIQVTGAEYFAEVSWMFIDNVHAINHI